MPCTTWGLRAGSVVSEGWRLCCCATATWPLCPKPYVRTGVRMASTTTASSFFPPLPSPVGLAQLPPTPLTSNPSMPRPPCRSPLLHPTPPSDSDARDYAHCFSHLLSPPPLCLLPSIPCRTQASWTVPSFFTRWRWPLHRGVPRHTTTWVSCTRCAGVGRG